MAKKVAPGVHRGGVVPPPAAPTAQQRHELEELDDLLAQLILQNRRLRARIDRVTRVFTGLGEDEVDTLLKTLRRRIGRVREASAAPRRRAHAA